MALILKAMYQGYKYVFEDLVDPRTEDWFLAAKPYQGLTILGLYLMFVLKWGPELMKNRRPFNLDKLLIVYNAVQIVFCAYIFWGAVWYAWGWEYKWVCEPVDFTDTPKAINVAKFVYLYFICKVIDLLDTVFFVLRKKFNQISFLHVYHHTGMVMLTWGGVTYLPGGHGTFIGVINSFVHIVMYGYYLLTVAYPEYKQSLWWKKYITQLQIIQFFWCVVHMATIVFKPDCAYPRWTAGMFLPQNLFMLILFLDFYIKTYIRKPKTEIRVEVHANGNSKQNGVTNGVNGKMNGFENGKENGVVEVNGKLENGNSTVIGKLENGNLTVNGKVETGVSAANGKVEDGVTEASGDSAAKEENGFSNASGSLRKRLTSPDGEN